MDAEQDNRARGLAALDFIDGNQWDTDVSNQRRTDKRPALTINHTNTFARRVINQLKQQRPRIKVHPTGDGADIDKAQKINGLIRHIETQSNASVAYDTGVESAVHIGWGYWRILNDYIDYKSFDQELRVAPIRNAFTVYMDPASVMPAGEDQKWCILSETMSRIEYKRSYPNEDNIEWKGGEGAGDDSLGWEDKTHIRLAEYFRLYEVKDTLLLMTDGTARLKSELPSEETMKATGFRPAVDRDGKLVSRETTRCQVEWYRINGTKVVDRRIYPVRCKHIPVIRCQGNVLDLNGQVKRKGMIDDLMDPARMFNYWRTAQTERYALTPKAPWVVAEGQTEGHPEWDNANTHSYSRLVYKPIAGPDGVTPLPPPQRTTPAQVEAGMSEAAQGAEHDLMGIAGMPQENPEISARVVSGNKYLQRRQGMQDLVHYQYYDNQTLAIMWTGIILLEYMPAFYDTARMQRIIGEDGVPQMIGLNQRTPDAQDPSLIAIENDMSIGRYDVVMDAGPGYQTKREESAEAMTDLLGTALGEPIVKMGADVVVRNMDFAGADELADRLVTNNPQGMDKAIAQLPKQAQTIIQTLQQTVQQQSEQLKQMQLELKYKGGIEQGWMQVEREKAGIKAHTDDANSNRDAAGWKYEVDQNKDKALSVAEIQVAGSLLNTHVEAAHDKAAAARLIREGEQSSTKN